MFALNLKSNFNLYFNQPGTSLCTFNVEYESPISLCHELNNHHTTLPVSQYTWFNLQIDVIDDYVAFGFAYRECWNFLAIVVLV